MDFFLCLRLATVEAWRGADYDIHADGAGELPGPRHYEPGAGKPMDYTAARERMVDTQLRPNAITDTRILTAMLDVARETFVPATLRNMAYLDEDLPLGGEGGASRFLMEPMTFAKLVQLADIAADDLVLDVGAATGYTSAVISRLCGAVVGLEADESLASDATDALAEGGFDNVAVFTGPLEAGFASQGPYDVIIFEGAVEQVPDVFFAQLRDGGRLAAVVQDGPIGRATLFVKTGDNISGSVAFDANIRTLPGFARAPEFVF